VPSGFCPQVLDDSSDFDRVAASAKFPGSDLKCLLILGSSAQWTLAFESHDL
jgi:hypothetical protein